MGKLETVYAVRKILADNAAIAAIVATRIYPLFNIPQNAKKPYITYNQNSADHVHHLGGPSGGAKYQIDVHAFADSDTAMRSLGVAIRKALDGYLGTVTVGGDSVIIEQSFLKAEMDDTVDAQDGSDKPIFIRQFEFSIFNKTETT